MQVESLKATSLIHAGKFSKLLNATTTSSTTASPSSSESSSSDHLRELLDEATEDEVNCESIFQISQHLCLNKTESRLLKSMEQK